MRFHVLRQPLFGDPDENRTRVTAVKGRCLDRLTNGPHLLLNTFNIVYNNFTYVNTYTICLIILIFKTHIFAEPQYQVTVKESQ